MLKDSLTDLPRPSALTVSRIDATETANVFSLPVYSEKGLYSSSILDLFTSFTSIHACQR